MRLWSLVAAVALLATPLVTGAVLTDITITCDNDYELYVNGSFVGVQNNGDGVYGWDVPETWTLDLPVGLNVIAVHGWDWFVAVQSGAGLIMSVQYLGASWLVTDALWRVNDAGPTGWALLSYDDSAWVGAFDQGPYDSMPWIQYAPPIPEFEGTGARWIWRGPMPFNPDYGYYDDGSLIDCYFRLVFALQLASSVENSTWGRIKYLFTSGIGGSAPN